LTCFASSDARSTHRNQKFRVSRYDTSLETSIDSQIHDIGTLRTTQTDTCSRAPHKTHAQTCATRLAARCHRPHTAQAAAPAPHMLRARQRSRFARPWAARLPAAPPAPGLPHAALLRAVGRSCIARRRPCRSARSASPTQPGRTSSFATRPDGTSKGVAWSLRGAATGRVSRQRAGAACAWAGASGMSPVSRCGGRRCRSPRRAPPRDSSGMHQKSLTSEERSPRAKIGR
jgi:hypothetical protein